MSIPFVTALIDTYNHESFIAEAINSVLEQDFQASQTEILVVDDGSSDRTPDIVRKFAPRVRLLCKANGGQASAFNAGIREARGEIVAFLDGDDWWAPGKLSAIAQAFAANPAVGLIGHGLTEVSRDGRRRTETPRQTQHLRVNSVDQAKKFRLQRGFLGTSRMAYRREALRRIGPVPEVLTFEADEYLFTLGALLVGAVILEESLTFYRLHERNLFQLASGDTHALRRKQQILVSLTQSLREKMRAEGIPCEIARTILECVKVEAERLRLELDRGFPWETISTELQIMRVFHHDASFWQHLFSCARILPAAFLPSSTYYRCRQRLSQLALYQRLRKKLLPFPVPRSTERRDEPAA